ncbi:hypothetical protein PPACK8108_LOCUS17552 [Phakopsora pachyrhizi]|uniref:Uncharacterized protein n=1 Tax=Phakopsora pachyrhizi TaxID=170000 RepID=A0AAV0BD64_PHAPC|nr:hypothetical protein PPACK8108_LOCUS17552 [Phakopsora pachyrhizi]
MELLQEIDMVNDYAIYILLIGGWLWKLTPIELNSSHAHQYLLPENGSLSQLARWHNSYGHIAHRYPNHHGTHGYLPLAQFLHRCVPLYKKCLYHTSCTDTTPLSPRSTMIPLVDPMAWESFDMARTKSMPSFIEDPDPGYIPDG